MAEMSRLFNFDDFDRQIAEALEEYEEACPVVPLKDRVPGRLGSVVTHLTFNPELPDPPEAA